MCDPENIFLTSKFSSSLFSTPPLKLTLGVQIGGRLLIANHLDQSLWLANQGVAVKSYVLYLFIAVRSYLLSCTFSFIRLSIPCKIARPKPLRWDYFLIQFDFVRPRTEHPWSCSKSQFPCDQPNQSTQHQ